MFNEQHRNNIENVHRKQSVYSAIRCNKIGHKYKTTFHIVNAQIAKTVQAIILDGWMKINENG